jgi:hypothetical protein
MQTIEQVASLRSKLWDAGFRPVPIYNPDTPGLSPGKRPWGEAWQVNARRDPPVAAFEAPRLEALNTGILCDGLRAIDIDVDNPTLAHRCRSIAISMFGEAPIRSRKGSSRCLILYRAAEGTPRKASVTGTSGKVEVLGHGQQFVAFGRHHEGADLEWFPDAPGQEFAEGLPAVTEDGIAAFLAACGPILGAAPPKQANGREHNGHQNANATADPLRIAAALAEIPNHGPADWEAWNRVGMAIWRATGGSAAGWEAFNAWSARSQFYDAETTRARWDGYASSPPTQIGAGTIFHLAQDAQIVDPFYEPSIEPPPPAFPDDDAGYRRSVDHDAGMSAAEWNYLQNLHGKAVPSSDEAKARAGTGLLWSIIEPWDAATIPTRPWIARGYLMRRSLTVLSGPGSAGKSSLMVAWASSLAVGCSFNRLKVGRPIRVVTYNVEDDADEQKRRFSAMCIRLGLDPGAFAGNLAILGPTQVGTLLHTARDGQLWVNTPVMDRLETLINDFKPDVLMLDPFVELHSAEENDNTAVRAVLARLRAMAYEHNMASAILHHARKGNGEPGDPDSLRGASSIVGAARVVLTVNVMTKEEASAFGIKDDKRRDFFRLDGAKNNYAPIEKAEWFVREVITLPNGTGDDDAPDGVAVAWPWHPPSVWAQHAPADINKLLDLIDLGPATGGRFGPTKKGAKNGRWVGYVVMETLSVNEDQAKAMISTWMKSGLLTARPCTHKGKDDAKGVFVEPTLRPTE